MAKKHEVSLVRSSASKYLTFVATCDQYLKRIIADHELDEDAVIKQYLTTSTTRKKSAVSNKGEAK